MLDNITTKITPVIGGGARYMDSESEEWGQQHLEVTFLTKHVDISAIYIDHDDYRREKQVSELLDRTAAADLRDRLNAWLEDDQSRTISSVSELKALPEGSVIRDCLNLGQYSVFTKDSSSGWDDNVWWQAGSDVPDSHDEIELPVTVLSKGSE